jgi:hypothetical protein
MAMLSSHIAYPKSKPNQYRRTEIQAISRKQVNKLYCICSPCQGGNYTEEEHEKSIPNNKERKFPSRFFSIYE